MGTDVGSQLLAILQDMPLWAYVAGTAAVSLAAGWLLGSAPAASAAAAPAAMPRVAPRFDDDVYLQAAEAIARAQDFLANLPGREDGRREIAQVTDYVNGAMGRLRVVADERTLAATMALANAFSVSCLNLVAKRRPISDLDDDIARLDAKIGHLSYERDQILAHITRAAGERLEGEPLWNDLNLKFDQMQRRISVLMDERSTKVAARTRLQHELGRDAAQSALNLAQLAVPAYLALREELNLPVDQNRFKKLSERYTEELKQAVNRFDGDSRTTKAGAATRTKPLTEAEKAHELKMVLKRSTQ